MVDPRATVCKQRSVRNEHDDRDMAALPASESRKADRNLPSNLSTNPASPARSTQRITAEQLAAATRLREYWMQRSLARYDGDKHARESSSDPAFASLGAGSPALEEYQYNFAKRTELVVPNNSTHGQATNAIQSSD